MEDKAFKRKMIFTKSSVGSFDALEKVSEELTGGKNAGNWAATRLGTGIIGLNMIDVIDMYENIMESDESESVKEGALLSAIHDNAIKTIIEICERIFPFVGADADETLAIATNLADEIKSEMSEHRGDEPSWDDVPQEILQAIADESGIDIDDLRSEFGFKAINVNSGEPLTKDDLRKMTCENTEMSVDTRCVGKRDDDREKILDEFINGME